MKRSIRDLVREERAADTHAQWVRFIAQPEFNATYVPIDRGIYEGWQRSWELVVLLTEPPFPDFKRLFGGP